MVARAMLALSTLLLLPAALAAHPLHGDGVVYGVTHFLGSPDHVVGLIAIGVVVGLGLLARKAVRRS
jgi:hydrogenase/urease accessory protein HupE